MKARLCFALALCLLLAACQKAPSGDSVPESPQESSASSKPVEQPEESSESEASQPEPSEPSGPVTLEPSAPPEPESVPGERTGKALLKGGGVALSDWQWVDKDRVLIAATYPQDDPPLMRLVLYGRTDGAAQELYSAQLTQGEVVSEYFEDGAQFIVDGQKLFYQRSGGTQLIASEAPEPDLLLPYDDDEFHYYDVRYSSDRKYFIFERAPHDFTYQGEPASDRVYVDSDREGIVDHPIDNFAFPFDVRVSPKTVRWINHTSRLLVDARIPKKDTYGEFERKFFVVDALSCKYTDELNAEQLGFSAQEAQNLTVRDTYKSKLLLELPGEPYEIYVCDCKERSLKKVVSLEGQNRTASSAKFSPGGDEIALLRLDTDLIPEYYPV